jgi:hypothetical protein
MTRTTSVLFVALVLSPLNGCQEECPGTARCLPNMDAGDAPWPLEDDAPVPRDTDLRDSDLRIPDSPAPSDGGILSSEVISRACGPADGFALRLGLYESPPLAECAGDPLEGSLTFFIHDLGGATLPPTSGTVVTSTLASSNGVADECPGGTPPCRTSQTWSVTFDSYTEDVGATGSYSVTWEGGEISTGNFSAVWCDRGPVICG